MDAGPWTQGRCEFAMSVPLLVVGFALQILSGEFYFCDGICSDLEHRFASLLRYSWLKGLCRGWQNANHDDCYHLVRGLRFSLLPTTGQWICLLTL